VSPHSLVKCKTFSSDWRPVAFFQTLEALKRASCGCRRWLWKKPVVMCGNWNVRQAVLQQVFTVTTFRINTYASSLCRHWSVARYTTLYWHSDHVHCRNKPLPQASTCPTCPSTRSYCSVPQTQYYYWGYAGNRKHYTAVSKQLKLQCNSCYLFSSAVT